MLSSEGIPGESKSTVEEAQSIESTDWEQSFNHEHIFQLIKTILPFEVCLHYQILPLELEGTKLLLGVVDLEDSEGMDYVSRIVSYLNCTIKTKAIAPQTHQNLLSAYLKHDNESQNLGLETPPPEDMADNESEVILEESQPPTDDRQLDMESSIPNPELGFDVEDSGVSADSPSTPELDHTSETVTGDAIVTTPLTNEEIDKSISEDSPTPVLTREEGTSSFTDLPGNIPVLPVSSPEQFTPTQMLTTLPPKKLLTELLGRVLTMGIGRLYLERQPYEGRIFWSENGTVQSVLETVPLSVYQGVLNELKRFLSLPVTTLAEPKQVEKEYSYQQHRLLLRLRVMPGKYGEEATLQVLRGAALKFYQKQQLTRLSQDTLRVTKQLSYKLHELQERAFRSAGFNPQQLEAFNSLNQLVENVDKQIQILTQEDSDPHSDPQ